MTVSVQTRGVREVTLRFDEFPAQLHQKLEARIGALTETLLSRVQAATPVRTGRLRSELTAREFGDSQNRVAGYVSVYAPGIKGEYAKAATLEYGTDKPRRIPDHSGVFHRLGRGQKSIRSRLTRAVHIDPFRYLRGPLEEMRPEITAALEEVVAAAANGTQP